jgi:hypothetical protein
MARSSLRLGAGTVFLGLSASIASVTWADVTIQEKTSVEGAGIMRMANMSGTSTTAISGKRARIDSDLQMESRMIRMFARGMGPVAEVVRLDEDKVYELRLKKKEYSEESLAARRDRLKQAMEQASKAQPPAAGVDESQCEWSEPKADVKRTGEKASVAGFEAERVMVTASQACRDPKSGSVCEFGLALDQWVAPEFAGGEDARQFYLAYAQQMGFDAQAGAQRAEAMFGRYKGMWTQVAAKMQDIKGYPVRSAFSLAVGGPQCKSNSDSGQAAGGDSGATPGGIAGRIAGSIFNRKKSAEAPAEQQAPATVNGLIPLLTVRSELVSVRNDALAPATFEVPPDFKKVAAP